MNFLLAIIILSQFHIFLINNSPDFSIKHRFFISHTLFCKFHTKNTLLLNPRNRVLRNKIFITFLANLNLFTQKMFIFAHFLIFFYRHFRIEIFNKLRHFHITSLYKLFLQLFSIISIMFFMGFTYFDTSFVLLD